MNAEQVARKFGTVRLEPDTPVVVGSVGTWRLIYTAGEYGFDSNGTLKIAIRMNSDWAEWQTTDPSAAEYVSAATSANARLSIRYETRRHQMPWFRTIVVDVHDGYLEPGDTITVTIGDTSGGGPGSRAQTFSEDSFEFACFIDPVGTWVFMELPRPSIKIVNDVPVKIVATIPSRLAVGEAGELHLRVIDRFGNPCKDYRGTVTVSGAGNQITEPYTFTIEDAGAHRFCNALTFSEPGVHRVSVSDGTLEATSNPSEVTEQAPEYRLYWGDIHGQTGGTVGIGDIASFYSYARDYANIDVTGHCANDWIATNEMHAELQRETKKFNEPGRFVTFLSYEWSGATSAGGDNNVYFLNDDEPMHRTSHWAVEDKSDEETDRYPMTELVREFRGRDDVMILPHVGGRKGNLDYYDEALMPAIEICSVHGRFPWFADEAFDRNMKVAFIASSDDHSGRVGATYPTTVMLGHRGGLVGIYAKEKTRESFWEAFKAKRLYGTTGERIAVWLEVDGHPMGSQICLKGQPHIRARVATTAPLDSVVLLRGKEVIYTHHLPNQQRLDPTKIRVEWSGARIKTRFRSTVWHGGLHLDGGTILNAEPFAFDSPWEGITHAGAHDVSWRSHTNGDPDGVVLHLDQDGAENATLTFTTEPATFTCSLADLANG
ncbi:MAG TPA: DUF3604 domain-containing protein, partial [Thermomicrobiales bacterium]|nr:DUF3604 domain-containing protein [Thermomicrobiales bacterium]